MFRSRKHSGDKLAKSLSTVSASFGLLKRAGVSEQLAALLLQDDRARKAYAKFVRMGCPDVLDNSDGSASIVTSRGEPWLEFLVQEEPCQALLAKIHALDVECGDTVEAALQQKPLEWPKDHAAKIVKTTLASLGCKKGEGWNHSRIFEAVQNIEGFKLHAGLAPYICLNSPAQPSGLVLLVTDLIEQRFGEKGLFALNKHNGKRGFHIYPAQKKNRADHEYHRWTEVAFSREKWVQW
jgi:hypothetical protein